MTLALSRNPALYPAAPAPTPRTLLDVLAETAAAHPHEAAVDARDGVLTYRALADEIEVVRLRLTAAGVGVGDRVGIRISSGTAELYVAILAVLAAGAAYVPVDADDPEDRAELVFGEAGVCVVLGDNGSLTSHSAPIGAPGTPGPDDDAWIIFTSGSTGTPKGVAVRHGSAAAFVDAEARLFLADEPIGPATGCWQACRSRSTPRARRCGSRGGTAPAWSRRRARWSAPGSTSGRGCRRSGSPSSPPSRHSPRSGPQRRSKTCGCSSSAGRRARPSWPSGWPSRAGRCGTPTGRPRPPSSPAPRSSAERARCGSGCRSTGWALAVVDGAGEPVAMGESGELVIGGVGLARYLDTDKDAAKFAALPSLGWERAYRSGDVVRADEAGLLFLGRADEQVKLGGRRIELGEVDAALLALPGVFGAAAAVRRTRAGNQVLVGYVVPDGELDTDAAALALRDRLPAALVPLLAVVDDLPTRTSGKVDRDALPWPLPSASGVDPVAAGLLTATEGWLAQGWAEILGVPVADPKADFFTHGGGSLTAAQLVARIRTRHPQVSVNDVYLHPRLGAARGPAGRAERDADPAARRRADAAAHRGRAGAARGADARARRPALGRASPRRSRRSARWSSPGRRPFRGGRSRWPGWSCSARPGGSGSPRAAPGCCCTACARAATRAAARCTCGCGRRCGSPSCPARPGSPAPRGPTATPARSARRSARTSTCTRPRP